MVLLATIGLTTVPVEAAKLTSATVSFQNVGVVSCGVSYRGNPETVVRVEIFNLAEALLDEQLTLSPSAPASWWRTTLCPEGGCTVPWCRITTTAAKTQFRATMCVEAGSEGVFEPITCVPVE